MEQYYFHQKRGMKYILLIYDISDNARRRKLAKLLESYGNRVQESAFEFWLELGQFRTLLKQVEHIMDKNADSIRIYMLHPEQEIIHKGVPLQSFANFDLTIC